MVLPTNQISFLDLRRVIGPNDTASISLGQCRPSFPPAYGNGLTGVTDTDIKMSQFRGKSKLYKSGLSFRVFKDSAYTFTAGSGGKGGPAGWGGGGGAGGILVNGGGPASAATSGWKSEYNSATPGIGGSGYGAGGGGGVYIWNASPSGREGGQGSNGFVYLFLNGSEFFASSNTSYNCGSTGILKFIMMGAGGGGGNNAGVNSMGTGGGGAGFLVYGSISVTLGTGISITIGAGGTSGVTGGTTNIVVSGIGTYSAAGGGSGTSNQYGGSGSSSGGAGGPSTGGATDGASGGNIQNANTTSQGSGYFNTAISSVTIIGGYFADNPSFFTTNVPFATGTTSDMTNLTKATNSILITNGSSTNFSVEWVGQFYSPTTGSYTFYLNSDDASYLWIGSNASSGYTTANANINNGGSHGMVNVSYTVALTGGTLYPMRIQYGQGGGAYDLQFSFEGPSIARTYNMDGYVYN